MAAAYTLYKFQNLIGLVLFIMIALAITSQIPSQTDVLLMTGNAIANDLDNSGELESTIQAAEDINSLNPKPAVEKGVGNYMYNLLIKDPRGFVMLCIFIAALLFVMGVPLKALRNYSRGLV